MKKQINNDFSNALTYVHVPKQKIFLSCMKTFYAMRNSLCNNNGYVDIYSSPVAYQLLKLYVIHCLHLNLASTGYHDMFNSLLKGFSLLYFLYSLMSTYTVKLQWYSQKSAICQIITLLSRVSFASPSTVTWGLLFLFYLSLTCYQRKTGLCFQNWSSLRWNFSIVLIFLFPLLLENTFHLVSI